MTSQRTLVSILLLSCIPAVVQSQDSSPPGIQDNSFLVEEAYNQEFGVVQHISSFTRLWGSKDWVYTFTQEWPVPGLRHQLSFTLPLQHAGSVPGSGAGVGDALLNYRYQLLGNGEARVAFAPRLSLILPTGDPVLSRGQGAAGAQTNLPLSIVLTEKLVSQAIRRYLILCFAQLHIWRATKRCGPSPRSATSRGRAGAGRPCGPGTSTS